ncbi:gas vesicle protein [Pullulanibacillus pueri]|uniref:Gas vesicle protein n=1 Tax=Pullulanibacillus pueri TaxID=1437324 RepID=A0A8J3ENA9_9BACL|nr:YtxH domain-containing protein [Pullulanibacillus pueri]MBM7683429.1 gas vesicle protein [Pullulanibacillus pueri]GGH87373.1 hypothetical protein GCM10007096_37240 [Pullulanibacillus pueri]
MGKLKSYIFGFTVGSVAAGITVLLNAPKPGKELRQDLKTQVNDIQLPVKELKETALSVKNNLTDFTQKSIPVIKSTVNEVKTLVDSWQTDIQPNLKKLSEEINDIQK